MQKHILKDKRKNELNQKQKGYFRLVFGHFQKIIKLLVKPEKIFIDNLRQVQKVRIMDEGLLTIQDVMKILNVSRATVYNLIQDKAFPIYKIKGATRIKREDVEAYLERQKKE